MSRDLEPPPSALVAASILAPPSGLAGVATVLGIQAIRAWGAASVADYPDWFPPVTGLIAALATILLSVALVAALMPLLRAPVRVYGWSMPIALFTFAMYALGEGIMAALIGDPHSYAGLVDPGDGPDFSREALMAMEVGLYVVAAVALAGACGLYRGSVQSNAGTRFDKRADERDALGAIIAEPRQ